MVHTVQHFIEIPQFHFDKDRRSCCAGRADKLGCLAISGSASDSVHRADLWTFPFRSRDRYAQCKLCRVCLVMAGVVAAMRVFLPHF